MTWDEILELIKRATDEGELTEVKMKLIDVLAKLAEWKQSNDELIVLKEKDITDRDEIIKKRDERITELEDSARRIIEKYGEEVLKKPIEVKKEEIEVEDDEKPSFDNLII